MTRPSSFFRLENSIQPYEWGTKDAMCNLFGWENPDQKPMAELWMGAHSKASSVVVDENDNRIPLDHWLVEQPMECIGSSVNSQKQLRFLFKVLSSAKALSIQVHPNKEQAKKGFDKEELEGIKSRDASDRNYKDDNHKPELICALTPFVAMSGFRKFVQVSSLLKSLNLEWLDEIISKAQNAPSLENKIIKDEFIRLLGLDKAEQLNKFNALKQAVISYIGTEPTTTDVQAYKKQSVLSPYMECLIMAEEYPGDIGIISPFLKQLFWLEPGQALFLGAGIPHAYLRGTGLEIMAASDNVLRGGLTPKFIDLEELDKVMTAGPHHISTVKATKKKSGLYAYPVPVDDFLLELIHSEEKNRPLSTNTLDLKIALCVDGSFHLKSEENNLSLAAGDSCLITAGNFEVEGYGKLALAGPGTPS